MVTPLRFGWTKEKWREITDWGSGIDHHIVDPIFASVRVRRWYERLTRNNALTIERGSMRTC